MDLSHSRELLPQIKRKANELVVAPQSIDKIASDLRALLMRNSNLEQLLEYIMNQSEKLRKENQFLWEEIIRVKYSALLKP